MRRDEGTRASAQLKDTVTKKAEDQKAVYEVQAFLLPRKFTPR